MAGKNKGAIDPVAIRELISQGIPMKKKESEMIPPVTVEEVDASSSGNTERRGLGRTATTHPNTSQEYRQRRYISLFMHRNDLYDRKAIYISKELQDKLSEIVLFIRKREMTLGMYVENILLKHLEDYKEEINRLSEKNFKKLL